MRYSHTIGHIAALLSVVILSASQIPEVYAQQPAQTAQENQNTPWLAAPPDDMFIDIQVPAHQVYLGQTMRIEYDVYVASGKGQVFYDAREPEFSKWYTLESPAAPPSQISINGKSYTKEPFAVYHISAYAPGKIPLPAMSVQIPYLSDKPWITHQTRIIEVIPPPQPIPNGFAPGNVGQFKLDVQTTASSIEVGQTIDIRIQITSDAPAPQIQPVPYEINETESFRLYPMVRDKIEESVQQSQFRSVSSFHVRLLALQSGNYTLPPVQLVTFDPSSHQYKTITSDPISVQVLPIFHEISTEQTLIHTSRMDKATPRPIYLIKTRTSTPLSLWFMLVAPLLFACALGGVLYHKKRRQHLSDLERHAHIQSLMHSLQTADSSDSQLEAIRSLLETRYQIERNLSTAQIETAIADRFSAEDAALLHQHLSKLHTLSYSTHDPLSPDEIQSLSEILARGRCA